MERTFPALREEMPHVSEFIEGELERLECPMREMMQISVAVEEIFINIASYAYPNEDGSAKITFETTDNGIEITFTDDGLPFNPLEMKDPNVVEKAEDDSIGGLGIFMVKKTMDNVRYEHVDGSNVLRICKTW